MQSIAAAVVVAVPVNKAAVNLGVNRYRQGKDDNVCKAVWVGTVKIPKNINANNDIEFEDYAFAA